MCLLQPTAPQLAPQAFDPDYQRFLAERSRSQPVTYPNANDTASARADYQRYLEDQRARSAVPAPRTGTMPPPDQLPVTRRGSSPPPPQRQGWSPSANLGFFNGSLGQLA